MTALELADYLDGLYCSTDFNLDKGFLAAAELRRLAELERDAARYRWLRDESNPDNPSHPIALHFNDCFEEKMLPGLDAAIDVAIDAAMGEAK